MQMDDFDGTAKRALAIFENMSQMDTTELTPRELFIAEQFSDQEQAQSFHRSQRLYFLK